MSNRGANGVSRSNTLIRFTWALAGILVVAYCAAVSQLSYRFVYGEGYAERPVFSFLVFYFVGWAGYAIAVTFACRVKSAPLWWLGVVAIAARAALLPSHLVLENDVYRYVVDGESSGHDLNPYRWAPSEVAANAPDSFRHELAKDEAQRVLSRVGHPDIPTVYPPAAQGAFAIGAWLTPWNWLGQRLVFLMADLITIAVLVSMLRLVNKPLAWIVVYAWNPLILKEIANSAHVDALVALGISVSLLALVVATRSVYSVSAASVAGLGLAVAVLAKLYPILLIPVLVAFLCATMPRNRSAILAFLLALNGAMVLAYLPYSGVGWEQMTAGLRIYVSEWERNAGAFAVLDAIVPWPRIVAACVVLAGTALATAFGYRARGDVTRLATALQVALLTWFLFLPAAYPWYAVGLIAVSVLRPRPWVVVLSGAFGLYYFHFWIDYHELGSVWHGWTVLVEHGTVWAAIGVPFLWNRFLRPTATTRPDAEVQC